MRRLVCVLFLISCNSDPGGIVRDGGDCASRVFFAENFESYAAGATLDSSWEVATEGINVSVGVSSDPVGHGANGSARYLLLINNGMPMPVPHEISAATPPVDLSGCGAAHLDLSAIIFSVETNEMDAAFIEWRAGGAGSWQLAQQLFPGLFASDLNCRPGNQDTTGCVTWLPLSLQIPPALRAPGFQARFRLHTTTDRNDALGIDDVRIVGDR